MTPQIADRLTTNLKDRWESVKDLPKDELETLKDGFKSLTEFRPVVAVVDVVVGTVHNAGDFLKDQSLIFRRWIER